MWKIFRRKEKRADQGILFARRANDANDCRRVPRGGRTNFAPFASVIPKYGTQTGVLFLVRTRRRRPSFAR